MPIEFIYIGIAFLGSSLYSGSEAAFYSANRLKLMILTRQNNWKAKLAVSYMKTPERYLSTILIGNNISNIVFGSLMAISLEPMLGEALVILVSTSIILVFGEILPKSITRLVAERAAMQAAIAVRISEFFFKPLIIFLGYFTRIINRIFGHDEGHHDKPMTKEDIALLFRESRFSGFLDRQDERFIQRVISLHKLKAKHVLVPRTEIFALPKTTPIGEIQQAVIRKQFTRLLIYNENIDHVVGVVHALDLLNDEGKLEDILRPLPVVPETKPVLSVLRELRATRSAIAVVIDEYGGTAGILTLEDIFEELFGEIEDEHDEPGTQVEELGANEFRIPGRTEVDYINERLGLRLPVGEYETIAGLIIFRLGKIPAVGETIELPGCRIIVTRATKAKISMVRLHRTKKGSLFQESIKN